MVGGAGRCWASHEPTAAPPATTRVRDSVGSPAARAPLRPRRHGLVVGGDRAAADGADLGVGVGVAAWTISLYALMLAVTTAVYGRVSDLVGVRIPLLVGIGLMTAGALVAALAPTFGVLLVARLFQGAGAAAVPTLGVADAQRAVRRGGARARARPAGRHRRGGQLPRARSSAALVEHALRLAGGDGAADPRRAA